jgi:hypothetical protein
LLYRTLGVVISACPFDPGVFHAGTKEGACLVMFTTKVHLCAILEVLVVFFQVCGIMGLCLNRLAPRSDWSYRGKIGFIVALFGLGIAGALCGQQDSEFSLFAGGTMTILLIGMTIGGGTIDTAESAPARIGTEAA